MGGGGGFGQIGRVGSPRLWDVNVASQDLQSHAESIVSMGILGYC